MKLKPGRAAVSGGDGLEVVGLLGVAHLDDAEGGFGEGGLEGEDVLRVARGLRGGGAGEGEHLRDVGDVLGAELDVFVAGAEVVVLLGQAEAVLGDGGDLFGGVFEVLLLAVAEEDVDVSSRCRSPMRAASWARGLGVVLRAAILSSRGCRDLRPSDSMARCPCRP